MDAIEKQIEDAQSVLAKTRQAASKPDAKIEDEFAVSAALIRLRKLELRKLKRDN